MNYRRVNIGPNLLRAIPVYSCGPNIINSTHFHYLKCPGLDTKLYGHSVTRTIHVALPKLCGNSTPIQNEKLGFTGFCNF